MTALLDAVAGHAREAKANAAFEGPEGPVSWATAEAIIGQSVEDLARRFPHQRPTGVSLDHSPASALLLVALMEAGVPAIPLPSFFTAAQSAGALGHAGAVAHITAARLVGGKIDIVVEQLDCAAAELPAETALISYSSGSTGDPKGVCLSAAHLVAVAQGVAAFLGPAHVGRHLPLLPFGILLEQVAGLFASVIAGATYVALPAAEAGLANPLNPDPIAMLAAIERERITSLILVPEYLAALIRALEANSARLPLLTLVAVGGARISPALLRRAEALALPVRQGYGLTETGSVLTLEDGAGPASGSVGRPIGSHQLKLASDGEILVDGPLYLGLVGAPRPAGPLATGDLGCFDDRGRLWIEGRKSNLIVTSFGRNVSPEWIEGLLTDQPEIAQAMVRGDGEAALEALLVPAGPQAEPAKAVDRVNAELPSYARIGTHRLVPPFTPMNGQLTANGRLRRSAIERAYAKPMDAAPFFPRLVADTRDSQARFAMTPQLIAGLTGRISRADYIAYLTEAYHHVRHTVPLMQEARARLIEQGNDLLVDALDEYIVEETGHEFWILDDIDAAGGDRHAAQRSSPAPPTKAMVDHAYSTIRNGNPAAFFGMVFVLEGTSTAMATSGARAVKSSLGLPDSAFRYLTSHGELDQQHMAFFEGLVNRLTSADDQRAIVTMARDMFGLFGAMFAGIQLEETADAG